MTQSQEQMISLIAEYNPDFDALGKTLGEKLLDGFMEKVGSVVDFYKEFQDIFVHIQDTLAEDMLEVADKMNEAYRNKMMSDAAVIAEAIKMTKADGVEPVVIHQTVNFNQPVESVGDTAARLARLNEELGAMICR